MHFDEFGREVLDQTPVSVPQGWERPLTLAEQIKRYVRTAVSQQAEQAGEESFEEADDFDVDEDPDPLSPYELQEAVPEAPGGVRDMDADPPPDPVKKSLQEAPNEPEGQK